MIVLLSGASHTGKTVLAQKLLERYQYPYLSIDHLKMGLIRSGNTELTPLSADSELTEYLWPIVCEIIKTAIENRQNLIVEGCFGWIDSTTKKMDNGVTAQRFAPRRKGSLWSELNKERCRRMERLGRMTDACRAVLPDMSEKGFVIDKDILNALQADAEVWANFQSFPPLYQRVRIDTIQIKKKQPELFRESLTEAFR